MEHITKTFNAEGTISQYRIVKVGAADNGVLQATAVSESLLGVCVTPSGVVSGDRVDVQMFGECLIECGGAITRGAEITTDANGKAVAAAPAAGTNNRIVGIALATTLASGDIMPVLLVPSVKQG